MAMRPDPAGILFDSADEPSFDPLPPDEPRPDPPRWWGNHLAELRWQAELCRLLVDPVYRGDGVPRGNGTAVLAIPGFLAGDPSLSVMREWLKRMGYDARPSGIVANVDCSDLAVDRVEEKLDAAYAESGAKVALIGHSRGAHFAKALAHRSPDKVSAVISLGAGLDTPFDISTPTKAAIAAVRSMHSLRDARMRTRGCFTDTCSCKYTRDYAGDFPSTVPLTSVYSRGDGVVRWQACIVPYANCVEVTGSHVGLAFNRKVYRVVGETLAAA
jgi:pimeloyl-ACP methyl ester carboxylesterase